MLQKYKGKYRMGNDGELFDTPKEALGQKQDIIKKEEEIQYKVPEENVSEIPEISKESYSKKKKKKFK